MGDSGGASGMYNSHFYEHSKRLLELVSGGREDMSPVNDPITEPVCIAAFKTGCL